MIYYLASCIEYIELGQPINSYLNLNYTKTFLANFLNPRPWISMGTKKQELDTNYFHPPTCMMSRWVKVRGTPVPKYQDQVRGNSK